MINRREKEDPMIDIELEINPEQKQQNSPRERSVFAIGYIRYKSNPASKAGSSEDEMSVLGLMVVQDKNTNNEDR